MFSNSGISTTAVLFFALLFLALLVGVGVLLTSDLEREEKLKKRIDFALNQGNTEQAKVEKPEGNFLFRAISAFGMSIARSGLLSRKTLAEMTATLEAAGFRGGRGLGLFIGAKILLLFLMPAFLYFGVALGGKTPLWFAIKVGGGAIFGMLLPDILATNIRKRHLEKVSAGVADALDMLVICADAGLALEAGIARVAHEIAMLNTALSQEMLQTSRELQIGTDMRHAMEGLGQRTGLDELKRLATTLAQSLQYGTPLTQALRSLSSELRAEALVRFEERAGRLPTLMTIPMILFILPCVFLIVAGPAMINVMATMKGH